MPVGSAFIRVFFALLLSLPVVVAITYYMVVSTAEDILLDPDFVTGSIQRSGYYDGVYRGALLRSEFTPWTDSFIGGFEVSGEDRASLMEEIAPKPYLRVETERNVSELLTYLEGSQDRLDLYVDLETPLRNSPPATAAFVDGKVQDLDTVAVTAPENLTDEIAVYLQSLTSGRLPDHLPSAEGITPEQRARAYREALDTLDNTTPEQQLAVESLRHEDSDAVAMIEASHLEEALQASGRSVAADRAVAAQAFVLDRSDEQHRLQLVEQIAENSDLTQQRILKDAGLLRSLLQAATSTIAQWTALVIAGLCILGIALLFVPYWKHVVFWPSLVLLISGAVLLGTALATTVDASYWVSLLCKEGDTAQCALTLGVLREMAIGMGSGIAESSLKVILIGSIGLIVAFVVSRTVPQRAS